MKTISVRVLYGTRWRVVKVTYRGGESYEELQHLAIRKLNYLENKVYTERFTEVVKELSVEQ